MALANPTDTPHRQALHQGCHMRGLSTAPHMTTSLVSRCSRPPRAGLLNEIKKFENGTICSSRTVRTVRDNTA